MATRAFAQRPELEAGDDGLLWADLWINIAFVLFALVSDPATSWLLPDTRFLTEGSETAPGTVLTFHLVANDDGETVLREGHTSGVILDTSALEDLLSVNLQADPSTSVVLAIGAGLTADAVLQTTVRLERAGARSITLAQSTVKGD